MNKLQDFQVCCNNHIWGFVKIFAFLIRSNSENMSRQRGLESFSALCGKQTTVFQALFFILHDQKYCSKLFIDEVSLYKNNIAFIHENVFLLCFHS